MLGIICKFVWWVGVRQFVWWVGVRHNMPVCVVGGC